MSTNTDVEDVTIRYLGDLSRLVVCPGDTFVLSCSRPVSQEQIEKIRAYWADYMQAAIGRVPPLLVLGTGMSLGLVNLQALLREQNA
jgi:hypothetical protein